jgi:G:T-mismatch repair DNA endonuclease (very short patch repair protein)/predicted nucleic acid-binding Zn ribbon protein
MKECVVCGTLIDMKDSVKVTIPVCSTACQDIRSKDFKVVSILTVSYWTDKGYTVEEANEKISNEQSKRSPRHKLYWTSRGFTDQEAEVKVAEVQSGNGKRNAELYTKEERLTRCAWTTGYWINKGYTEDEAKAIITKNADTQSLESYISRYGEAEGTLKYNELCNYRKETYTLEGSIARHGEEKGEEVWQNRFANKQNSKVAADFFNAVIAEIPTGFNVHVGGEGKKEFGVRNLENNKYYLYDFVIPKLKVCVEFHGDYWHCNPTKYSADYYHTQANKYAADLWAYDQLKIDTMTKYRGYDTTVVWESEAKAKLPEVISMINERYAIVKAESPHLFEDDVSATEPISENDT